MRQPIQESALLSKRGVYPLIMPKKKNEKPFDPADLKTPEELLKFEIATELGLSHKVMEQGWRSLTAKESGRIGGLMTKRKRELKEEAFKDSDSGTAE